MKKISSELWSKVAFIKQQIKYFNSVNSNSDENGRNYHF